MPSARLEILKRAALIAGAINSAPLKSASFRPFLAESRKGHIPTGTAENKLLCLLPVLRASAVWKAADVFNLC